MDNRTNKSLSRLWTKGRFCLRIKISICFRSIIFSNCRDALDLKIEEITEKNTMAPDE